MTIYEYVCRDCNVIIEHDSRNPPLCPVCHTPSKRRFSFNASKILISEYNPSVGMTISSKRQYADILKRMSEERSERLGMTHNFVPVDKADAREVFGVTDEGLDETAKRQMDTGQTAPKFYSTMRSNGSGSGIADK